MYNLSAENEIMKIATKNVISCQNWDELVSETYGRPYSFQQQDDCKDRGVFNMTVPDSAEDYENSTVPEVVNHPEMGVSFKAWLARDPNQKLPVRGDDYGNDFTPMWWDRNFYPDVQMVANDLHAKGLLEAGEYIIEIDW
jgi:hypothetical protein